MTQVLVEAMLLFASVAGLTCILLATVYDVQRVRLEKTLPGDMRRMTQSRQPRVSIVITDVESVEQLVRCLRSIKKSRYKRYDVVAIINHASPKKRQQLMAAARMKAFHIYSPRLGTRDKSALLNAYKRSQRGALLGVFSARDLVEPMAIKRAVTLLDRDRALECVKLFGELDEPASLSQLYEVFSELNRRLMAKASIALSRKRRQIDTAPAIYRHESVVKAIKSGSWSMEASYLHGLGSSAGSRAEALMQWYHWALRLLLIGIFVYVAVTAAMLQSAWPLMVAWIIVCLWLGAAVWSDETLRLKRKAMISMSIPIGMFLVVASYIVGSLAAMLRIKTF